LQSIAHFEIPRGERKIKKEKKKKSEEKKVKTKKPQLASRPFVAAIASVLSALQACMKDGCEGKSMTESATSLNAAQAKDEQRQRDGKR